jgi:hypothetical protein
VKAIEKNVNEKPLPFEPFIFSLGELKRAPMAVSHFSAIINIFVLPVWFPDVTFELTW